MARWHPANKQGHFLCMFILRLYLRYTTPGKSCCFQKLFRRCETCCKHKHIYTCRSEFSSSPCPRPLRNHFAQVSLRTWTVSLLPVLKAFAAMPDGRYLCVVCWGQNDRGRTNYFAGCRGPWYCSNACQRSHWRSHRRECQFYHARRGLNCSIVPADCRDIILDFMKES